MNTSTGATHAELHRKKLPSLTFIFFSSSTLTDALIAILRHPSASNGTGLLVINA